VGQPPSYAPPPPEYVPPGAPGRPQQPLYPPGFGREGRPPAPPTRPARRQGFLGGLVSALLAIWAFVKYGGLFLLKFGALKTLITLAISFWAYAVFFGPGFAAGLVVMILVHEMGHVIEIRRQGMKASAPLFIPFFGAAIFQRQHATDALHQAEIGIAGPIAGTVGATAALVLYGTTHQPELLVWAYLGFFINLINLIPLGMLDGGWILGAVSKWFQIVGVAAILLGVFVIGLSPFFLVIGLMGIPTIMERFRNDRSEYYQSVPVAARWAIGVSWLVLVAYLGFAMAQTSDLLHTVIGA
jgi:Zn-dependent protease